MTPDGGAAEVRPALPGRFLERRWEGPTGARDYRVYVPSSSGDGRSPPLIVVLHGCTQDALDIARGTRMNERAEEAGLLVVYPEQPKAANEKTCWNWYDPAHQRRDSGEASMIAGITAAAIREWDADPTRVFIAGISAGAAMAANVVVAYPELWAGAAFHSGLEWGAAADVPGALQAMQHGGPDPAERGRAAAEAMGGGARVPPVIIFHGTADPAVLPVNGVQAAEQWLATRRAIRARAPGEAPADAASAGSDDVGLSVTQTQGETAGLSWTRTVHAEADGAPAVERWSVEGLGHAWSGGSGDGTYTDPRGPDATSEIVRFFLAVGAHGSS